MRKLISMAVVFACAAVVVPAALAATATPFGGATVSGGILTLVSNTGDAGSTNDASGATFAETGVTTFSSISTLSTEFDVTDDDCKGGSPRFQVRVQTPSGEKNVFVYLGPSPSFTGCSTNVWIASGNLIGAVDGRYDTSHVQAGTQVSTYAQANALVGSYQVTGISLVVDAGWAFEDKEQTVKVRNVRVNGSTFYTGETTPPTTGGLNPAQACRKLRTEMGADAFRTAYGTNRNGANAFGKCVSAMARMKTDTARAAAVTRIDAAAARCAKATVTAGKGKGKAKGLAKKQASLAVCLKKTV
ncbi:MAG TPA: hypothetical protein VFQ28_04120 [Gaiella sp.]|nr:hypothetical protein [Gaiella sp.]